MSIEQFRFACWFSVYFLFVLIFAFREVPTNEMKTKIIPSKNKLKAQSIESTATGNKKKKAHKLQLHHQEVHHGAVRYSLRAARNHLK